MQIGRKYDIEFGSEWPIESIRDMLCGAHRTVLVAHTNADGDAVGSLVGMYILLRSATSGVLTPILPDGVPSDLVWLPDTQHVLSDKEHIEQCREAIAQADLIVGLDISSFGRTGELEPYLRQSHARKILVDHHEQPEQDAFDAVVSEPTASSTCELVYWLMESIFGKAIFDRDAATCLFAGLCTDTGTFSYSNDRPSVYLAAADLLAYGIDPMHINRQIKNVFTTSRMHFFGYAIAHRLAVYPQRQLALMVLSAKDMSDNNVESSELTGLINEVMRLRDIDCGILIREEGNKVRLSMRSKELYDVNQLASTLFDGGGHKRAAGATSYESLEKTVEIVKQHFGIE